jgi:hypothetical protein
MRTGLVLEIENEKGEEILVEAVYRSLTRR